MSFFVRHCENFTGTAGMGKGKPSIFISPLISYIPSTIFGSATTAVADKINATNNRLMLVTVVHFIVFPPEIKK